MEGVLINRALNRIGLLDKLRQKTVQMEKTDQELLNDLGEIRIRLDSARCRFEYALEDELVDAAVFEIDALESRYNYLMKEVKRKRLVAE